MYEGLFQIWPELRRKQMEFEMVVLRIGSNNCTTQIEAIIKEMDLKSNVFSRKIKMYGLGMKIQMRFFIPHIVKVVRYFW